MKGLNAILAHHAGARLYHRAMGRYPSPGELAQFVDGLGQGITAREQLAAFGAGGDIGIAIHVLRDVERLPANLGRVYQQLQGMEKKKGLGQVFTPPGAVEAALNLLQDICPERIIDPSCGAGDFLLSAALRWPQASIKGIDIDPLALAVAKTNLDLEGISCDLLLANALMVSYEEKYDLVVGNPPWGSKLSHGEIQGYQISGDRLLNSFVYFLELAAKLLKPGGHLAFVLPEAFIKVRMYEDVRRWALDNFALRGLHYIPNLFRDYYAPAILVAAIRLPAESPRSIPVWYQNGEKSIPIRYNTIPLTALSPERFNINWDPEMEKLWGYCSQDAVYLEEACMGGLLPQGQAVVDFSLGIVTGDNDRHVKVQRVNSEHLPLLSARDITSFKIKTPGQWLQYDAKALQQAAPLEKYQVPEKIVYKFIAREIITAVDRSGSLTLNNLNIIVPLRLPFSTDYLTALLNSRLINTLYMYKFFTGKVLTRNIKQLPLIVGNKLEQERISALARKLATAVNGHKAALDKAVYALYGLDKREQKWVEKQYLRLRNIFFV